LLQRSGISSCLLKLERKGRLKINAAIRGLGSTAPAAPAEKPTNRVRLAKQGRADSPLPRPQVYIIKEIPGVGAEREVEAPTAGGSPTAERTPAPTASTQPARAKPSTPAATATTSTTAATTSTAATEATPPG